MVLLSVVYVVVIHQLFKIQGKKLSMGRLHIFHIKLFFVVELAMN